ncbi:ROK family transcriptional regulator [Streptomyces spongiae]|uniref:ROK family transcriptional regulator n=1 Tax=Streptomyces spongiae TaxID=565072 RepID=A0A5N8XEY1_9ACTN|nr:ROK family transcriptional regulator [Streptomyces spongiae]MPY57115.1 ROK family transcriptional regulator [Streptomyces spongiae]
MHKDDGYTEEAVGPGSVPLALRRVLGLVVSGAATNRAEIARRSGLARSTVGQQVDHLVGTGILEEVESRRSVRGRPPRVLTISPQAGTIAAIDVDTADSQVAIADLTRRIIARETVVVRIDAGPQAVLDAVSERLQRLLKDNNRDPGRVREVVVGLPGPVDFQQGCAVQPTGMPGWDGYPVAEHLQERLHAPVVVDNDVNLMALGEVTQARMETPLLCIKIATGIGSGLITATGDVYRGADGAAGDIGHIRAVSGSNVLCACGNVGCVGALASHRAVLRSLGIPESTEDDPLYGTHELARRVASGDPTALHAVRQAATEIGEVVAMLVHMFNPRTLVLAGPLSQLRDDLVSAVRAAVYQRALPLATRKLTITATQLKGGSGLHGGIALGTRDVFSPAGLARLLAAEPTPDRQDRVPIPDPE